MPETIVATPSGAPAGGRGRAVRVPVPARFDFEWAVGFLSAREVRSIEQLSATGYARSVRVGGAPVALSIRFDAGSRGAAALVVHASPSQPRGVLARLVTRMFDLDAEVDAFVALAARDPVLATLVARQPYIRLPQLVDPFEGLIRAILGQQVSVAAASTMADRLARLVGERAPALDGMHLLCFPSPESLAALGEGDLLGIGLTRAKAASIAAAARAVTGGLDLSALRGGAPDEVDALLTAVRGIGPWTAAYLRMRALGDRDAFPASDLGIVKAMRDLARTVRPAEIARLAERWRPWRAYAALHLWQSLSGAGARDRQEVAVPAGAAGRGTGRNRQGGQRT
ncbi:MAG: DNA-3-methyladenine glycosylase family protein [Gemmatimonadaceae bacterium]